MKLQTRVKKLEALADPEKEPPVPEFEFLNCQSAVTHPELFDRVEIEPQTFKDVGTFRAYELRPKDPDFVCNCHCCRGRRNGYENIL